MAGPQVQKQTDGHKPETLCAHTHLNCSVIKKSSKDFIVRYSTCVFFGAIFSFSLSTLRFVPLNIASVMAFLYAAKSRGEVRSSTSSSVSKSSGFLLFLRLRIKMDWLANEYQFILFAADIDNGTSLIIHPLFLLRF